MVWSRADKHRALVWPSFSGLLKLSSIKSFEQSESELVENFALFRRGTRKSPTAAPRPWCPHAVASPTAWHQCSGPVVINFASLFRSPSQFRHQNPLARGTHNEGLFIQIPLPVKLLFKGEIWFCNPSDIKGAAHRGRTAVDLKSICEGWQDQVAFAPLAFESCCRVFVYCRVGCHYRSARAHEAINWCWRAAFNWV